MTVHSTAPTAVRTPPVVRAGAALLAVTAAASSTGVLLFGVVQQDDPVGAGLVFAVFMLVTALTAVTALPSLLRGSALGWALTFGWGCCYTYWSVYKVFAEQELESLGFLAAGTGVVALLATRTARRHAGIAP